MHYEVAFLGADGTPSDVRLGFTSSEKSAAYIALATSRKLQRDTCVVAITHRDGDRIVEWVRYVKDAPPLERRQGERRFLRDRRGPSPVESYKE